MFLFSDLVFFSSILACISLGRFYKNIDDPVTKRSYGTGLGLLITFVICGTSMLHSLLMVCGNIIIIKCCNKKYMHQLSLVYTCLFLIYMRYNTDLSDYTFWVHQAIALRLVGLAFEIALAEKYRPQKTLEPAISSITRVQEKGRRLSHITVQGPELTMKSLITKPNGDLANECDPSALDIISYAYYFVGLHKGPYYRWKVFNEHFKTPFGKLGDCRLITEQKLKKALIFSVLYILLRAKFPVQIYNENDFYTSHSTDFRYLYNIPQMFKYVLQYQVIMMLCTSVCTEAGFGIYPVKTQVLPGFGPTTRLSLLNIASAREDVALELEYNFSVIRSFENEKVLMGPRMRDTLRGWDMSIRYWFWTHTYKDMVIANKDVRRAISFLAFALWGGLTIQQLVIASTLWVHLYLEHEYAELYDTRGSMKVPWNIGFSIMRLFCLTYLTPCFILNDQAVVLRYYNSIFWVYHMILLCLIIGAVGIQKERIISRRRNTVVLQ